MSLATCEVCGAEFRARYRPARQAEQKYCSTTCRGIGRRVLAEKTCAGCGLEFRPRRAEQKHCSESCIPNHAPAGTMVQRQCIQCGGSFMLKPHMVNRQRFCSVPCRVSASTKWPQDRKCAVCGQTFSANYEAHMTCSPRCGQRFSRASAQRPWRVGPRVLLARTCDTCGALLGPSEFALSRGGYHENTCIPCARENLTEEQRDRVRASSRASMNRMQEDTRGNARRRGYEWSGPELEIALREDLTAREAALMLGRTYFGVESVRRKARREPKWIALAGLARHA